MAILDVLRTDRGGSHQVPTLPLVIFTAAYVAAAKIGFFAALMAEQVSPVWPPTGLALWGALWFGPAALPAIWIGAFIANVTTHVPVLAACSIATGNMLEALVAVYLLRRFGGVDRALHGIRHVTYLVFAAALVSTTVSATIGVATLCVAGMQPWTRFTSLWWTWWLGDAGGDLLVAPLLLTTGLWKRMRLLGRGGELVALVTTTAVVSAFIFAIPLTPFTGFHPLEFGVFPLVIWAGLRFGHPGAALVNGVVSMIAVWGTLHGVGPFGATSAVSLHQSTIFLQIFTAVIATSGLLLGAAIVDRMRSERLRAADHALTTILAGGSTLHGAAQPVLNAMCDALEWDVGILWSAQEGGTALAFVDGWRRDARFDRFIAERRDHGSSPPRAVSTVAWSTRQPAVVYDLAGVADSPDALLARELGLQCGFGFPIQVGARQLGVLEFFARDRRRVDASVDALMSAAGTQLGQFIERTRSERRLVASEALNSAIVSTALDCIVSIDADGRIIEFNPAATRTFGFERRDVLGKSLADVLVPEPLQERHRNALERCVRTGESTIIGRRIEMPARRADGEELTVEVAVTRVVNSDRPIFTAHLRDITDKKRIEIERADLLARERRARAEAEQANRAKDQFLATVSHELRTPLTAILGWASMLRTRQFEEDRLRAIYDSIFRNAETQAQIVNDLLDVSRIVTGQLRLDLQPVDICDIARLSVETMRPTAVAKRVRLDVQLPEESLIVSGDAARLQQVVWNLVSNAVKFTPAGGTVRVSAARTGESVAVDVSDTGIGLPAQSLPHVFERFWQADNTSTRVHGGLGLGLALVRHLVEIHGGEVKAASEGEHRGSTFTVTIPGRAQAPPEPASQDAHPHGEDTQQCLGLRALVVDDDPSARELFATILASQGASVDSVASGPAAIAALEQVRRDVLVIDIGLPGEDGMILLRRIHADDARRGVRRTPAVAVTAYAGTGYRDAALAAGFMAHLPKPVLPDHLLSAVIAAWRSAS